ncbi:MAG: hypothetical protein IPI35_04935 [Deltaproteobacteria bacterium]|nr:hypothetical protein [Deltaproteobacteria bacterium]
MRFVSPVLMLSAAAFVYWNNQQQEGTVLAFPFISTLWPAAEGDPVKMGQGTVALFVGVGVLSLIRALSRLRRDRQEALNEASETTTP